MIQVLYLGRVDYAEGLRLQAEMVALVGEGRLENVLLLLEHPPVLTLGRNARRAHVLASDEMLAARGVTLHEINRGGDVTYHGPGQLVGYPIFNLRTLKNPSGRRMGPVDFVRAMEEALIRLCGAFGVQAGRVAGLTGVWCAATAECKHPESADIAARRTALIANERKIAAIGIHVSKGITSHGFAFNVTTDLRDFELIIPCGIPDHAVTSLQCEMQSAGQLPTFETVAHQAAMQFGKVFDQQLLVVENLDALREQASKSPRQFPAEDTPLSIPAEVDRLRLPNGRPVQA